jgi:hypothetical protein
MTSHNYSLFTCYPVPALAPRSSRRSACSLRTMTRRPIATSSSTSSAASGTAFVVLQICRCGVYGACSDRTPGQGVLLLLVTPVEAGAATTKPPTL